MSHRETFFLLAEIKAMFSVLHSYNLRLGVVTFDVALELPVADLRQLRLTMLNTIESLSCSD